MLYLALSCFQGWPMEHAARSLLDAGCDGIQLTPGCVPTPAFGAWLRHHEVPTRTHDGFSWRARRQPVWTDAGSLVRVGIDSVHPPSLGLADGWIEAAVEAGVAVEVMYPGHPLGDGPSVDAAVAAGLHLAVDVSHVAIQRHHGVLTDVHLRTLLEYERIVEVHVSASDGRADQHRLLTRDSFGLDWARERATDGIPVIYEAYLHRATPQERAGSVALVRERVGAA